MPMRRLASFVKSVMQERNLSFADVERKSRGTIKYAAAYAIANARNKDVGILTLIALARGLGVTIFELVNEVVGDKKKELNEGMAANILTKFSALNSKQQTQVMPYFKALESEILRLSPSQDGEDRY